MDGIQRLANMLEGQKDKYLIKITNYLMTQTDMQEAFLKKEKNYFGRATGLLMRLVFLMKKRCKALRTLCWTFG